MSFVQTNRRTIETECIIVKEPVITVTVEKDDKRNGIFPYKRIEHYDFTIDGYGWRIGTDSKGHYIRWGSFEANFWFNNGAGKTLVQAIFMATYRLPFLVHEPFRLTQYDVKWIDKDVTKEEWENWTSKLKVNEKTFKYTPHWSLKEAIEQAQQRSLACRSK
jgi:hypothetical protein